jgi:leucyl aminopeptidase
MQAEKFYQEAVKEGVCIELVTQENWSLAFEKLSQIEKNQLVWQNFTANVGEIFLVVNSQGDLKKVFLGVQEKRYFLAIANAANKLPAGHYYFNQELNSYDLMAWGMAQYKFARYKKIEAPIKVLNLDKKLFARVMPLVEAIFKVRDLINTPAEDMGPEDLSMVLESLAQRYQGQFSSIIGDDLLAQNFPAIYTVGRAGHQAPRLLKMSWGQAHHPKVTLVGKGVCFDSGGLDLKPASAMRTMKKDMGGAAQVIGLAQLIMHFNLPISLQVLIPAVENTIDSFAYRPGDVIRMRNGLHVEIDNTDAEGRLVMADALSYACEQGTQLLLDYSTLTGAARTAVGTEISALFCNQDDIAQQFVGLGMQCNDFIWQLPLYEPYQSMLDSNVADMTNSTSSPYAGAITAALFLKRFIHDEVSWGHFDLMAWNIGSKPGRPEGGEAMGMIAVFEYFTRTFKKH